MLAALEKKPVKTPKEAQFEEELKNLIVHGTPLDATHPGIINLSPLQEDQLNRLIHQRDENPRMG